MATELIIFSAILVLSVIAHYFFWRDSKKKYEEYMERAKDLNERLKQLEANDFEIDRILDATDGDLEKMGKEINALSSVLFHKKKMTTFDN